MPDFKFSLISDMHVDHPQPKTPYDKFEQNIIVAGDTSNGLLGLKFLNKLKNKGFGVFAIDGNHEHYSNLSQGRYQHDTQATFFEQLDQGAVLTWPSGARIIGCNGWYPVTDEQMWQDYMNDSKNSCLSAAQANKLAEDHATFVDSMIAQYDGKVIVVTHTAPCEDTLDETYFGYFSNEWYWNPHMYQVLKAHADKILVWCHGHTHAPNDKIVEGVRVVCNPRGYPGENPTWSPKTIEVSW